MTASQQDDPGNSPDDPASTPARSTDETNGAPWKRAATAALGGTLLWRGARRRSLGGAAAAVAGGLLLYRGVGGRSVTRALGLRTPDDQGRPGPGPFDTIEVEQYVTVGEPANDLFELWRDPEQLTRALPAFVEVTAEGENRQRWTVRAPLGRSLSWETRIVEEQPGEALRWESVAGATVPNEGSVRFRPAPGDRGTEVTLGLRLDPPGGALGTGALRLGGVVPATIASTTLDRFKSLAETGEIPTLEHNPSARGSGDLL